MHTHGEKKKELQKKNCTFMYTMNTSQPGYSASLVEKKTKKKKTHGTPPEERVQEASERQAQRRAPPRMAEFPTLSLRECPATQQSKLISAACIRDLDPKFMTIGKGRNVDQPVNQELRFLAQFSLHHYGPAQCSHYAAVPIRLSIS
ncbi:hypothetical protein AMECASPLE_005728 [Ameca splendens]|uniref:Uncharacterized protein n=1 Tax=Ameca splendens TaxID=208324 RepID=A0ABV1A7M5_9TELE